jgi:hypothetical protein
MKSKHALLFFSLIFTCNRYFIYIYIYIYESRTNGTITAINGNIVYLFYSAR